MLKKNAILILISLYLFCAIGYAASPFCSPEIVGWTTFVGEAGMDILICILSLQIYNRTDGKRRFLFGVIAGAFFCEIFADGAYNLIQNVLNISNPSTFVSSLYEIPFLSFLCLQAWVWWVLFAEANTSSKRARMPLPAYLPFIISSVLVIAIFTYFADWKIERFSGEGLYQLADILAEAAGFALVSTFLGTSASRALSCVAIGFLVIVCSNYMIRLPVVALATTQNSPYEFTWIAGQLLAFYGLLRLKRESSEESPQNWCYGVDCLQSQIAVGSFSLGLLAIFLFSVFVKYAASASLPDESLLKYLPPVMIILSIITVILSSYFSKQLLKPLKELEAAINAYSSDGKFETGLNLHDDYGIREYVELKAFIKKALVSLNAKLTVEREISLLAASVSHDIASPLAVMEMTVGVYGAEIPLDVSSLLKDSIQRVRGITQTLLKKYRTPVSEKPGGMPGEGSVDGGEAQTSRPVLFRNIIQEAVSQKRIEWMKNPCEITVELSSNLNAGWVMAVPDNLKRIISNLLNNSYEALQAKKEIYISMNFQGSSWICLEVADSGCGIAPGNLSRVQEGESSKHSGRGLGLSGAKAYIESIGGALHITSKVGEGTNVKITLPLENTPSWFPENILIQKNAPVIVLDDDEAMCAFWKNHLKPYCVEVFSFTRADALLNWCRINTEKSDRAVCLFDCDIQDLSWSGLTLLERLRAGKRGYLVTSSAEDAVIQRRCLQLGSWLIPKRIIRDIPLKAVDISIPAFSG